MGAFLKQEKQMEQNTYNHLAFEILCEIVKVIEDEHGYSFILKVNKELGNNEIYIDAHSNIYYIYIDGLLYNIEPTLEHITSLPTKIYGTNQKLVS